MPVQSWSEEKVNLFRVLWENYQSGVISEDRMMGIFKIQTRAGLRAKARQLGLLVARRDVDIEEIRKLLIEVGQKPSKNNEEVTKQAISTFSK